VGGSGYDAMEGADRFADAAPVLAGLAAASVRGVLAVGGVLGRPPGRLGEVHVLHGDEVATQFVRPDLVDRDAAARPESNSA